MNNYSGEDEDGQQMERGERGEGSQQSDITED